MPGKTRVLAFTRTAAARGPAVDVARDALRALPGADDLLVTLSEDPREFTPLRLTHYDVVAFIGTSGDVLNDEQQAAFEGFIRAGGGFVGVHSAASTEPGWGFYGALVGAVAQGTLAALPRELLNDGPNHPITEHLPPTWEVEEALLRFDRAPRRDAEVLLAVAVDGEGIADDPPVSWAKEWQGGRSFYTQLGGEPRRWSDPRYLEHLVRAIRWAGAPATTSSLTLSRRAKNPMELAVAPDGRVFFIERTGEVFAYDPGSGQTVEVGLVPVSTAGEGGLLGLAIGPDFTERPGLYLYYGDPTPVPPPAPPGRNVVARFDLTADGKLDLGSRRVLLEVPSERDCCHEGGALAFHPDGTLLVSVGDNTNPFQAQGYAPLDRRPGRERFNALRTAGNPFDLRGKLLRIRTDGSIPDGNLYPKDGSRGRPEVFVSGVRNPFRMAITPEGRVFWGDVGPDAFADGPRGPRGYDEVNLADTPGEYGWPRCIAEQLPYADFDFETDTAGPFFDCSATRPALLAYDYVTIRYRPLLDAFDPEGNPGASSLRFTGRTAIAATFLTTPPGAPFSMPAEHEGALLVADWTRDLLASVHVRADGTLESVRSFFPWFRARRPIDAAVAPDGALLVLEYGSGYGGDNSDAALTRIEHSTTGELSPVAVIQASRTWGAAPLEVEFDARASRQGNRDDPLAVFEWDLDGDGILDAQGATVRTVYQERGGYRPRVVAVSRSGRRSLPAVTEIVVGNTPPVVRIESPAAGEELTLNQLVRLSGSIVDAEDDAVDCDQAEWDLRLIHNAHSHPLFQANGCQASWLPLLADHAEEAGPLQYLVEFRYRDRGGPNGEPPLLGRAELLVTLSR